jgi:hypothetical protein
MSDNRLDYEYAYWGVASQRQAIQAPYFFVSKGNDHGMLEVFRSWFVQAWYDAARARAPNAPGALVLPWNVM